MANTIQRAHRNILCFNHNLADDLVAQEVRIPWADSTEQVSSGTKNAHTCLYAMRLLKFGIKPEDDLVNNFTIDVKLSSIAGTGGAGGDAITLIATATTAQFGPYPGGDWKLIQVATADFDADPYVAANLDAVISITPSTDTGGGSQDYFITSYWEMFLN